MFTFVCLIYGVVTDTEKAWNICSLKDCFKGSSVCGLLSSQPEEEALIVCHTIYPIPRPGPQISLGTHCEFVMNSVHGAS